MEILGTKRLIPKGCELGTTLSWPNQSIPESLEKSRLKLWLWNCDAFSTRVLFNPGFLKYLCNSLGSWSNQQWCFNQDITFSVTPSFTFTRSSDRLKFTTLCERIEHSTARKDYNQDVSMRRTIYWFTYKTDLLGKRSWICSLQRPYERLRDITPHSSVLCTK